MNKKTRYKWKWKDNNQNLWDTTKAVLWGKFIAKKKKKKAYIKKQERSHKNDATLHLKELEEQQTEIKVSRRKKIIEIIVEIETTKAMKLKVVFYLKE